MDFFDPFGDDALQEDEKPEGYSILRGKSGDDDSEEAQGRRVAHHLRRIQQAHRIARTRGGALTAIVEQMEADLAKAKADLRKVDSERDAACAVDRRLLQTYFATAPQFHDPALPRQRAISFGDMAVDCKRQTRAAQLVLADEGAVMRQFPDYVAAKPVLEWARLRKTLRATSEGIMSEDGEIVDGVYEQPRVSEDVFAVLIDGKRVPLTGGTTDGTDDPDNALNSDDGACEPDDPFGE